MISKTERIYVEIFLRFLNTYGNEWVNFQDEFKKHVALGCRRYGVREEKFYAWLSRVIFDYIGRYVDGNLGYL